MARFARRLQQAAASGEGEIIPDNILVGKVFISDVADSTSQTGNPIALVTDQSSNSRWISEPESPVNLVVDLEGFYTLDRLKIVWAGDTIKNYVIAVSDDELSWTTIVEDITDNTPKQTVEHTSFSATPKGRYLRITGTDRWDNGMGNSIWEVEAYGVLDTLIPVGVISNFSAHANSGTSVALSWTYTGAAVTDFTLRRDGIPLATPTGTSYTDTTAEEGTAYTYSVTGNYQAGGASNTASKSVTTPGGDSTVPVLGLSGMAWNSGVFYGNGDLTLAEDFGNWRGRPVDSIMYFPGRATWGDMLWLRDDLTAFQGYRIVSLPTQPTGMDNSSTAAGSNNTWWEDYGQALTDKGWDDGRTILRLNWESNVSSNDYAANQPDPATFIQAYRNVVTSVRTTAPNILFNICWNKGPDQSGSAWYETYPGDDYVDILGLDWYDHWPAIIDDDAYEAAYNQICGGKVITQFARDHNKKVWLDEWAVSHWSGQGGGDNPYFVQRMWDFINDNLDVIIGETVYNDAGSPSTLNHEIYPRNSGNPFSSDKYVELWGF